MPETLCQLLVLLPLGLSGGRDPMGTGGGSEPSSCSLRWRGRAWSDWLGIDGGVIEPLVGVLLMPWLPSLEASVDRSVRKLALERLRSSLRLKMEGAICAAFRTTLVQGPDPLLEEKKNAVEPLMSTSRLSQSSLRCWKCTVGFKRRSGTGFPVNSRLEVRRLYRTISEGVQVRSRS
jgi:hypothetical protein